MAEKTQAQYQRGSVVLVRFPFTDLSGSKLRPAVVVSPTRYLTQMDDVLCAFISSSIPSERLASDLLIESDAVEFAKTGLKRTSILRSHKLALLKKNLVYSKLGELSPPLQRRMDSCLSDALGLK